MNCSQMKKQNTVKFVVCMVNWRISRLGLKLCAIKLLLFLIKEYYKFSERLAYEQQGKHKDCIINLCDIA